MRSNFIPKIVIGFTIACVLCGCGAKKSYQVEVDLSVDNTESEMEEEFDTEIPDEEAEKITTVQAAIDYINGHQA